MRVLARLRHPNIVTIHDSGEAGGLNYIVMDYVDGPPLDEYIGSNEATKRWSDEGKRLREMLELFALIAEAVNAAHLIGVIHRDLKPSNVRIDADGQPKILDFGLAPISTDADSLCNPQSDLSAVAETRNLTATGQFVGSLPYASPEQAEGLSDNIDIRTDASASEASAEASKQEAVNAFLQDLLAAANPSEIPGGRDLSVREAVNKAAGQVNTGTLQDQPEVHAAVRATLGSTELALGDLPDAETHLTRALEIRERAFGRRSKDVAESLLPLGSLRMEQGRLKDAEPLLREARQTFEGLYGRDHPRVAIALNDLGDCLRDLSRLDEAEPLHEAALSMRRKLLGNEHPSIAASLTNLGNLLKQRGRNVEADEKLREALGLFRKLLGIEHASTLICEHNLALVLLAQDRLIEAEQLFREVLTSQRKQLGEDHPHVAASLHNPGVVLKRQGRLPEAETVTRDALRIRRSGLPPDHADITGAMICLGEILLLRADPAVLEEAGGLLGEARDRQRKVMPAGSWKLASTEGAYGAYLTALGRHAEAEPLVLAGYAAVTDLARVTPADKSEALKRVISLYERWDVAEPGQGNAEKAAEWRSRAEAATP